SVQGETGTHSLGQYQEAEKSQGKAIALLMRASAPDLSSRRHLAHAYYELGRIRIAMGRQGLAQQAATRCVATLQTSAEDRLSRMALSDCYELLSDAAHDDGRPEAALEASRESLRLRRLALHDDPSELDIFAVAMSAGRLADSEKKQGDLVQARQHLGEVVDLLRPLTAKNPFSVKYTRGIEIADQRIGSLYSNWFEPDLGEPAKAAEYFGAALTIAESLARAEPASPEAAFDARLTQWMLTRTRLDAAPEESVRLQEEIVAAQRKAVSVSGRKDFDANWLAAFLVTLGESYGRVGRMPDGIRALREACDLATKRAGHKNASTEDLLDLATAHRVSAELYAKAGQSEQAARRYAEALDIAR